MVLILDVSSLGLASLPKIVFWYLGGVPLAATIHTSNDLGVFPGNVAREAKQQHPFGLADTEPRQARGKFRKLK